MKLGGEGTIIGAIETCAMARDKDCCLSRGLICLFRNLPVYLLTRSFTHLFVCLLVVRRYVIYTSVCLSGLSLTVAGLLVCLGLTCSSICCGTW